MASIEIPGYKIVKTLGVGGQATVYLAIQQGFDREVALKVMSPALAADPTFGERFIREAKIVAKLQHPNIVTVYDVGEHDGFYYLAMEYLPGTELRKKISQGIKSKDAVKIVSQVAKALHYAHDKGYIHRDVKSENILFRNDNQIVLTDFGIAKASNSSTQMTQQGKLVGTPQYMSPEQCRGRTLDGRSDLYSLGIIFYEMLTGNVPYDGEDSVAVCLMHVTKPIPKLPIRHKHYQWLVDRLLAKKSSDRFNNGEELAEQIASFLQGETVSETSITASRDDKLEFMQHGDSEQYSNTDDTNPGSKSSKWLWLLVILLGASTAGFFTQEQWLGTAKP
ncbi:MAG: serine/threonine-protein kinase, partial [Kangiellaceae bacterium]|nr:serine/threonine-protein kinase [Kangiellaceae bacterium]